MDNPPTAAAEFRHRAQRRLSVIPPKPGSPRTDEDTRKLLHELEVHQIELELQNEELLQLQEDLTQSRNKFEELYELAPIAYFYLDTDGRIRKANRAGAQLFGREREPMMGQHFASFIVDAEGRQVFADYLERLAANKGTGTCELCLTGEGGAVVNGLLQGLFVVTELRRLDYILVAVIDRTVNKQLQALLQASHDNLELIVKERTLELKQANVELLVEVDYRKRTEELLKGALEEVQRLKDRLQEENVYLREEVSGVHDFAEIIGQDKTLLHVFSRIEQVAPQDTTVLLLGETGTGKGVIARAIHNLSARKDRAMVTVNCTSLPANLIESELFGRERGAFTGANVRQMGRFELADGGTIFLDEIGEMPLELQSKLLRVIQDGEFERLGSPRTTKVNVRIIAASNRNLQEEARAGRFREDLFYRLNVFPITIPPLRQRREDIPLLVNYFVAKFNKKIHKKVETVSKETLSALKAYSWPGNVRELESVIERAVITSPGSSLQVLDRFDSLLTKPEPGDHDVKAIADLEREHILHVLLKTGWRVGGEKGAALLLGLHPSTLRARMRKLGIRRQ